MSRRKRERETPSHDDHVSSGHRHARLQQIIAEELEALLRDELSDPDLRGVRFAGAELSVDYRALRVRFLTTGTAEAAEGEAARARRAFERAAGYVRHRLDEALDLKRVPELHFLFDREAAAAHRAARILEEITARAGDGEDG
jgi:ribosome-binding factor A